MKLSRFLCAAVAVSCLAGTANAGLGTLFTTNVDMNAAGLTNETGLDQDPPLPEIRRFSASSSTAGIYTNQVSGTAGSSGEIRTVVAGVIANATDTFSYSQLTGPDGGTLLAVLGMKGDFINGQFGSVEFTEGSLRVYELASLAFDPRNPESWLVGLTLLEAFPLADFAAATGDPGDIIAFVPQSVMNTSVLDAQTIGDTDFTLGFQDIDQETFLSNYEQLDSRPNAVEAVYIEGEQDINFQTLGADLNTRDPGTAVLDSDDIDALNAIAFNAGLGTLGGVGTELSFATALGGLADIGTVSSIYSTNPGALQNQQGSGDFFATAAEANFRPLVSPVPEPGSIAIFAVAALGMVGARRRKKRTS